MTQRQGGREGRACGKSKVKMPEGEGRRSLRTRKWGLTVFFYELRSADLLSSQELTERASGIAQAKERLLLESMPR